MSAVAKRVITFGTFDVFHVGHLKLLERARERGGSLTVGVSSDDLNYDKKGRYPVYDQAERMLLIGALRVVDGVFLEESLEQKRDYIIEHEADILVMGDDWSGKFNYLSDICEVVYLPRTPAISTTAVIEKIRH
ncbi:MAG: adenylyltransferase/cytidyltransferase family protein [Gammaproteobacteria bacterium]|nr:adenylyltransferase/cytidyltransferase family protein [Gammaproteobacteria bacterium]MDH3468151.1 adenylyltransferase/cytidyltransferase family protein [Gammaproteobacteria bacterium]